MTPAYLWERLSDLTAMAIKLKQAGIKNLDPKSGVNLEKASNA